NKLDMTCQGFLNYFPDNLQIPVFRKLKQCFIKGPEWARLLSLQISQIMGVSDSIQLSPAFLHDSLKFEFFGTSFKKSSLIKKLKIKAKTYGFNSFAITGTTLISLGLSFGSCQ
ncbi:hypothetical protein BpHYR1_052405, partial [Brachionus plicatilis]